MKGEDYLNSQSRSQQIIPQAQSLWRTIWRVFQPQTHIVLKLGPSVKSLCRGVSLSYIPKQIL